MAESIVVLTSGTGTLLQALLDSHLRSNIVAIGSDRAGTRALERAELAGLPTFIVDVADFPDRDGWSRALLHEVASYEPTLVACAGFMRILGPDFVSSFRGRIVNCHPALLPAFPGVHAVRDALAYGVRITGCTVHLVDEGVDTGPIIAQRAVDVLDDDDEPTLHERIKVIERELIVASISDLIAQGSGAA